MLGHVRIKDFRRRHADRFIDERSKEVSPPTINRGLAVLKNMLSLAVEREYLKSHPLLRYRMLPEVQEPLRIMTYGEYRKLVKAIAEEDLVIGVYTFILGETGLRKSEGLRLRWDHIHDDHGEKIVAIGNGKSGKARSVPLSNLAVEWLQKLVRFIDIPYVFVDPIRRRPWKDPRGPFFTGRAKVGLDWISFHDLRHFRATQWLMNNVDVNTVRELLGHSSIQTTMRYVHYVRTHAAKSVREAQRQESELWQQDQSVDTNWIHSK